jgi:hypothetical protein
VKQYMIYLYGLVFVILILRIPMVFVWDNHKTEDDAAIYIETAINFAKGEGYRSSILRHFTDREILSEYIEKNGITSRTEYIPPVYILLLSGLYVLTGEQLFFKGVNFLNIILFGGFLLLYVKFLIRCFSDEPLVVLLTLFIIGFNSIIFRFNFAATLETIYLFTFMIAFLNHIHFINKVDPPLKHYIIYSFALALFLFSKYSAIPFVAAFIFHHLYINKYKSFILTAVFTFIIVAPWMFIRPYLISGHPFPHLIIGNFPFLNTPEWAGFGSVTFYSIYSYFRDISTMLYDYIHIDLFFFLVPFVLIFLFKKTEDYKIVQQTGVILFIFAFLFFGFVLNDPVRRYQFILLIPIMPFVVRILIVFIKSQQLVVKYVIPLLILVVTFGIIQLFNITEYYNYVRKSGYERSEVINNSLELVHKSEIEPDKVLLVNILGFNVFSNNRIVLTPRNINRENKFELLEFYGIDYVLFAEGEIYLPDNIFMDLELIAKSEKREGVYLYKVKQ